MYFVYITTNLINNKKYLGFSSMKKKNWETYLGSGKALKRAVLKYGESNFKREILQYFKERDGAIAEERRLILEYNCHLSDQWYNIATGFTTQGFKGKKHSPETIDKMKKYHTGQIRSEESKIKQSSTRKKRDLDFSKQARNAQIESVSGSNHPRSMSFIFENEIFSSITEISQKLLLPKHLIMASINGDRRTLGESFTKTCYIIDPDKIKYYQSTSKEERIKNTRVKGENHSRAIQYQYDDKLFNTTQEILSYLNISKWQLLQCISNPRKKSESYSKYTAILDPAKVQKYLDKLNQI